MGGREIENISINLVNCVDSKSLSRTSGLDAVTLTAPQTHYTPTKKRWSNNAE